MIFFIILKQHHAGKNYKLILAPSTEALKPYATSDIQIIAWNEVPDLDTLDKLRAMVLNVAANDPVCLDLIQQAITRFGIDPLLKVSGQNGTLNRETTEQIVRDTFFYWAHPQIGNIANSPAVRPALFFFQYIQNWDTCAFIDEPTKLAMNKLYKDLGPLKSSSRDQVRICYNITELARAIIGEITSKATRRLEKLLALRLCSSQGLLRMQSQLLTAYMNRRGKLLQGLITRDPDKGYKPWGGFEYCRYYLPGAVWELKGEDRWYLFEHLLSAATNGTYKPTSKAGGVAPMLLKACDDVWNVIPHTIRCAILMNDLRKVDNLTSKANAPAKASLGLPDIIKWLPLPVEAKDLPYQVVPSAGTRHVPSLSAGGSKGWNLTWSWNRDEYHDATITYRHFLCPLWGGPSGHTAGGLQFWIMALDKEFPEWGPAVITCGLFTLWRLYYDKRISANHTMTETLEATCTEQVTGFAPGKGPLRFMAKLLSDLRGDADAFELVLSCSIKGERGLLSLDPICVFHLLENLYYRTQSSSVAFDHNVAFAALAKQIDAERTKLAQFKLNVPQWAQELSLKKGTDVKSFGSELAQTKQPIASLKAMILSRFVPEDYQQNLDWLKKVPKQ